MHATHGFDHFLWSPKSTFSSPFDAFEDAAASTEFKEEKEDTKKKTKKKRKRAVLKAEEEKDWERRLIFVSVRVY